MDATQQGGGPLRIALEIVNGLQTVLVTLVLMLFGGVKALIPNAWLPKKSVAQEVVLITGAGSGIGRLMALEFSKLGSRLVLWDVNEKGNAETAKQIKALNGEVKAYTVDLSSREEIYKCAEKVKAEVGDVDMLINNAGIVTGRNLIECPDALIQKTMDVNTMAHFWTVKAFLPSMVKRNHGHIVSIASAAGLFGCVDLVDYCASKFAAVGMMESLALEMDTKGHTGVHTTTVCPFYINTGMFDGVNTSGPMQILEPNYVVHRIVEAVLVNQAMLMMPRLVYFLYYIKGIMPTSVGFYLGHRLNVTHSMDHFTGRNKIKKS